MLKRTIEIILRIKMTENIEFIVRENKWMDHVLHSHSEDRLFFCIKSYISVKCFYPKSGFNQPTAEQEQPTGTTNTI